MIKAVSEDNGRFTLWDADCSMLLPRMKASWVKDAINSGREIDGLVIEGGTLKMLYSCIDMEKSAKMSFAYGCQCLIAKDGACLSLIWGSKSEIDLKSVSTRFPFASIDLTQSKESCVIVSDGLDLSEHSFIGGSFNAVLDVTAVNDDKVLLACMNAARANDIALRDREDRKAFSNTYRSLAPYDDTFLTFLRVTDDALPEGFDDWFVGRFDKSLVSGVTLKYAAGYAGVLGSEYHRDSGTLTRDKAFQTEDWYDAMIAPLEEGSMYVLAWLNYLMRGGTSPCIRIAWDTFISKAVEGDLDEYTFG